MFSFNIFGNTPEEDEKLKAEKLKDERREEAKLQLKALHDTCVNMLKNQEYTVKQIRNLNDIEVVRAYDKVLQADKVAFVILIVKIENFPVHPDDEEHIASQKETYVNTLKNYLEKNILPRIAAADGRVKQLEKENAEKEAEAKRHETPLSGPAVTDELSAPLSSLSLDSTSRSESTDSLPSSGDLHSDPESAEEKPDVELPVQKTPSTDAISESEAEDASYHAGWLKILETVKELNPGPLSDMNEADEYLSGLDGYLSVLNGYIEALSRNKKEANASKIDRDEYHDYYESKRAEFIGKIDLYHITIFNKINELNTLKKEAVVLKQQAEKMKEFDAELAQAEKAREEKKKARQLVLEKEKQEKQEKEKKERLDEEKMQQKREEVERNRAERSLAKLEREQLEMETGPLKSSAEYFLINATDYLKSDEEIEACEAYDKWMLDFEFIKTTKINELPELSAEEAVEYHDYYMKKMEEFIFDRDQYFANKTEPSIVAMLDYLNLCHTHLLDRRLKIVVKKAETFSELEKIYASLYWGSNYKTITVKNIATSYQKDKSDIILQFKGVFSDNLDEIKNNLNAIIKRIKYDYSQNAARIYSSPDKDNHLDKILHTFKNYTALIDEINKSSDLYLNPDIKSRVDWLNKALDSFNQRLAEIEANREEADSVPGIIQAVQDGIEYIERAVPIVANNIKKSLTEGSGLLESARNDFDRVYRENTGVDVNLNKFSTQKAPIETDKRGIYFEGRVNTLRDTIEQKSAYLGTLKEIQEKIITSNDRLTSAHQYAWMLSTSLDDEIANLIQQTEKVPLNAATSGPVNGYNPFGSEDDSVESGSEDDSVMSEMEDPVGSEIEDPVFALAIKQTIVREVDSTLGQLQSAMKKNKILANQVQQEINTTSDMIRDLKRMKLRDQRDLGKAEKDYFINSRYKLVNSEIFNHIKEHVLHNEDFISLKNHGKTRKKKQISLYIAQVTDAENLGELMTAINSDPKVNEWFTYSMRDNTTLNRFFGDPKKSTSNSLAMELKSNVEKYINDYKGQLSGEKPPEPTTADSVTVDIKKSNR